jgi:hypothetical protein
MPVDPPPNDLFAIARPLLMIASAAFVMGFAGYLAFGRGSGLSAASPQDRLQSVSVSVSGPISDDWNPPKRI